MVKIALEASNGFLTIACLDAKTILAERNVECSNNLSAIILKEIELCLKEAGKEKKDLTEIITSEGPGSYTAIRVVAAVAKTLAYSLRLPLKTISSLKLQALAEWNSAKLIVPLIDARRGNVFGAVYKVENNELKELLKDGYYSLDEVNNFIQETGEDFVYVGNNLGKLEDKLLENKLSEKNVRAADIIKIYSSLKEIDVYNMKPQYLRKTEAERELENDKNK